MILEVRNNLHNVFKLKCRITNLLLVDPLANNYKVIVHFFVNSLTNNYRFLYVLTSDKSNGVLRVNSLTSEHGVRCSVAHFIMSQVCTPDSKSKN